MLGNGLRQPAVAAVATLATVLVLVAGCTPGAGSSPGGTKTAVVGTAAGGSNSEPARAGEASRTGEKSIKIGLITALTGRMAGYGARQKIAVTLAVEDVNNNGGINGSPLEVIMVDDAADPSEVAMLVRRLAKEDRAVAILGPLTGASFEVAGPLADELGIPLVTASSVKPGSASENRQWVFRFASLEEAVAPKAVEAYRKTHPNVKRMVISGDTRDSVSGHTMKYIYPEALKDAGLEVIGSVAFDTGTTDFSAVVAKIKGLRPDGIAFSSLPPEAVAFSKELQRQGVRAPVLASLQNWAGPEVALARDTIEGWIVGGTFDEDTQDPRGRSYLSRFLKMAESDPAVGKPAYSGIWASAYDTIMAMAQVMRTGKITADANIQKARSSVGEGLRNLRGFKGITGIIDILPNGDVATAPLAFSASNGRWVLIK